MPLGKIFTYPLKPGTGSNVNSMFGRLLSGFGADKIGKFNAFIISCYLTGLAILALWIPGNSQAAILAFAVLFGFFSGAYISLIGALTAQISTRTEIGFRTGLVFLVASLPALTTGPIAGAIFEHTGDWTNLKIFAGVLCIAGTTVILGTRLSYTGFKLMAIF
jgi:MFS transporter, MCT family, aspergillic acid transporter